MKIEAMYLYRTKFRNLQNTQFTYVKNISLRNRVNFDTNRSVTFAVMVLYGTSTYLNIEAIYLREKKYAVSEKFIQYLVIKIWKHTIYTDGRHGMMT